MRLIPYAKITASGANGWVAGDGVFADLQAGQLYVGRTGEGAAVQVGRHGEPGLSAQAVLFSPRARPKVSGEPPRGQWLVGNVNGKPLEITLTADAGGKQVLGPGDPYAVVWGDGWLELALPSGPARVRIELQPFETPDPLGVPAEEPSRTGTRDLAEQMDWTDRQREVMETVFPQLKEGLRPDRHVTAEEAADQLDLSPSGVRDHLLRVRNNFGAATGMDVSDVGLVDDEFGQLIFDRHAWPGSG